MKIGRMLLALVLAGGALAAYYHFPDPLGEQVAAARQAAAEEAPAAATAGEVAPR